MPCLCRQNPCNQHSHFLAPNKAEAEISHQLAAIPKRRGNLGGVSITVKMGSRKRSFERCEMKSRAS